MQTKAQRYRVPSTGDEHSFRFADTFEKVYSAPDLAHMEFNVLVGNHDHKGKPGIVLHH